MPYVFDQIFAVDEANPQNVARNSSVLLYQIGDATKTPVTITTPGGDPLPNPVIVNENGFGPIPMHQTLDSLAWEGGGFGGVMRSYDGMKDEAVAARAAAEAAAAEAATAGAAAAAEAASALAGAVSDAEAAQAAAESAAALVGAPADTAMAAAANNSGSQFRGALNATYAPASGSANYPAKADVVPKWKATTAYASGDKVVSPSGDIVSAKTAFTSGASYNAANWDQPSILAGKLDFEKSKLIRKIERAVLTKFPRPRAVAIGMSGTTVCFYQEVVKGKWWRTELPALTFAGGGAVHQITGQYIAQAFALVGSADAGIVYAGGTWFGNPGEVRNARAANQTATWTSPSTATDVLLVTSTSSNGGLAKVTVDGSATAANQCMTAQQVVDNGWYPNTILVTNGGTLNPTDRVIDFNSASLVASTNVLLATGLAAAAHVIVITSTAYFRVGKTSTDIRTNIFGFGSASGQALGAAGTTPTITETISTVSSAWEYALKTRITSGGTSDFLGNVHGYETETSSVIAVDGVTTTVADGSIVIPRDTITYTRTTQLTHPQSAGAKVADVVTVYTLTRDGLSVEVTVTWAVAGWLDTAYLMLPLPGTNAGAAAFNRIDLLDNGSGPLTITGTDGTVYRGRSKSAAAWAWQSAGKHAVALWADDALGYTNNWANAGVIEASFEDRGGILTKLYLAKVATPAAGVPFAAGEVHKSKAHYVMARFESQTPDAVFG